MIFLNMAGVTLRGATNELHRTQTNTGLHDKTAVRAHKRAMQSDTLRNERFADYERFAVP